MVAPDFQLSREVPSEAALNWLQRAVTISAGANGRVCQIDGNGIRARSGHATASFCAYRTHPYGAGSGSLLASNLGYSVYLSDTRDSLAGWVVVSRKDLGTPASGGECYVYNRSVTSATAEGELAVVKSDVECTLGALASLGVEVVEHAP